MRGVQLCLWDGCVSLDGPPGLREEEGRGGEGRGGEDGPPGSGAEGRLAR